MTVRRASTIYNIPKTTLLNRKQSASKTPDHREEYAKPEFEVIDEGNRYKKYTQLDLRMALDAVCSRRMGLGKASARFGIPRSTLVYKSKGFRKSRKAKTAPILLFGLEEEAHVASLCLETANANSGTISRKEIAEIVKRKLDEDGRETAFPENRPTYGWCWAFTQRYPEIPAPKRSDRRGGLSQAVSAASEANDASMSDYES